MSDPRLGRRIIAEARLQKWEARVTRATRRALARHEDHAKSALRTTIASYHPDPFNLDGWDASVLEEIAPIIDGVLEDAAASALAFMKLPAAVRARILGQLDIEQQAASFVARIQGVGPRIASRLKDAFTEGLANGESVRDLEERVDACFEFGRSNAETIARTEVHGSAMQAGNESAQALHDSGVLLMKQWLTQIDDRTRDEHADADGQTVAMDEFFVVGGEELEYPGDPGGSAENVINCRCDVLYDTAEGFGEVEAQDEADLAAQEEEGAA